MLDEEEGILRTVGTCKCLNGEKSKPFCKRAINYLRPLSATELERGERSLKLSDEAEAFESGPGVITGTSCFLFQEKFCLLEFDLFLSFAKRRIANEI